MGLQIDRCQPRSAAPALLISGALIATLALAGACAGAGRSPSPPVPAIRLAGAPALGFRPGVGLDPRERRGHPPVGGGATGPRLPGPGSRAWQYESQREQALDAELDAQAREGAAQPSTPRATPRAAETPTPVPRPANVRTPAPHLTPRVIEYRLPGPDRR